ncbi:hypothetical protein [Acidianus sp. RZ1]|uniref:hypothetical protein n=1 Tax=Acidianus sp. RZ1 TaxID=1540082 RepID=UPI001491D1E5|nr:hypothetical protein [Acidianus sp. RZ1]NON63542.1 hypothetical protein [Acidianus sp. RZ1]
MSYVHELILGTTKSPLFYAISDPYRLVGMSGHINILGVYDKDKKKYVVPSEAENYENKYWASLIYEDTSGRLNASEGSLELSIIPNSIDYKFNSEDEKVKFSITFTFYSHASGSKINIMSKFDVKPGVLVKPFYGSFSSFAEHIVKGHIVPYLNKLITFGIEVKEIKRIKGELTELIGEIKNLPKVVGIISIKGENFSFASFLENGELKEMRLLYNKESIVGGDSIVKLLSIGGSAEMIVYEIPKDEIVTKILK